MDIASQYSFIKFSQIATSIPNITPVKNPLYVYSGDNDNSGFYRDFGIFDFFSHNILYYGK